MLTDTAAYIERYRWTPTIATVIAGDLAFVAVAVVMSPPLIIRVLVIAVFGWFAVYSVAGVLSRKIALQVDEAGVTLGGGPFRYRATTRFHPWANIGQITLWQRYIPLTVGRWTPFALGPIRYIGLRRRPGAPSITAAGHRRADSPAYGSPVAGIAAGAARNITAFVLDPDRLAQAVTAFAPQVTIRRGLTVGRPARHSRRG